MIEIRNLSGGYGGTDIVKGITATFENGCLTVIVGANGCGKTTLLRLCGGLLRAAGGEIKIDGRNVVCYSRTELAQRISVLPQSRAVPDITAGALVLHGRFPWLGYPRVYRAEDKAAAEKAMERVGIMDKRHKLLANISGGERQRVYTAMLLAQDTKNLLLDEPTTYLDVARQL
jgi:iron complex transport system ATP-binding protein